MTNSHYLTDMDLQ